MVITSNRSFFKTRQMSKETICDNPNCRKKFYTYTRNKIIKYCPFCFQTKAYLKLYK